MTNFKRNLSNLNNLFKTCPYCGKEFPVYDPAKYAFKARNGSHDEYFDKISCKTKWLEQQHAGKLKCGKRMYKPEAFKGRIESKLELLKTVGKQIYDDYQAGIKVTDIMQKTGMSRAVVYRRISQYEELILNDLN